MSQERTEKATPKRREDARKKGQIARGAELSPAFGFLGALLTIKFLSENLFELISNYFQNIVEKITTLKVLTSADLNVLMIEAVKSLAFISMPIMFVALICGLVGNFMQGGFTPSFEALKPKGQRFNPVENFKRVIGVESAVNVIKSVLKLILIALVAYAVLSPLVEEVPAFVNSEPQSVAVKLGEALYGLAFRCGLILIVLAIADYGYAYYRHEKSLRMTKQEIREEFKESEGDPLVKNQRRRAARSLVQKLSLAEVPKATVVITNPTHLAIALRYEREKDPAPVVVAKGAELMASKIREIAMENDIPLVENKPLARLLYKKVEINQIIPAEFFGAVAEILAFVYRQKR